MPDSRVGRLSDVRAATPPSFRPDLANTLKELRLSKPLGITQFGVNQITLRPGHPPEGPWGHWHEQEDEFLFVLSGAVTLVDDNGEHTLREGDFAAFPAGVANPHYLANRSQSLTTFLVIGTRHRGLETIHYPIEGVTRTLLRDEQGDRV